MTDVVCLGILVADVIARPVERVPESGSLALVDEIALRGGGCALNTGTALARLGLSVACAGKVGEDVRRLRHRAAGRARHRPSLVARDAEAPTSATVVLVDEAGERTFLHVPGANGSLSATELDVDRVLAARALHVAGALVMPALDGEPTAALLAEARRRGVVTSLDTVWDATGRWSRLEPSLPHLDVLCLSRAEACALSGEREPEAAAAWARARGARTVAITLGADGCYVEDAEFARRVPASASRRSTRRAQGTPSPPA